MSICLHVLRESRHKLGTVPDQLITFAAMLRERRREARLTQDELAAAASLSLRTVSDLERGVSTTPQRSTVRLLADALRLTGPARAALEAAARGRVAPGGVAAATRTLPRDVAGFVGRQRELQELTESAAAAGGVVSIHAIGGMAGVGKTALAVHAAHQLADRYPDGQIFLPLHGHTPGQQPVEPADALASLLLTAGISPGEIPAGLEARAALWRDRLADQRLLLVLDDAVGTEQVLPLLPGAGPSLVLVLVTSRRHLTALEGASDISLEILRLDEAAALLIELAGRAGLSPDVPAVQEIVRLCGFLPLAIGLVGRQLRHHPAWSLSGRRDQLAAAVDRLALLTTESVSVAAAFDLSYANLAAEQQLLVRRLGLHPGAEFDDYAAAALGATGRATAHRGLTGLYEQYLLTEVAEGRYRMHDLIRVHSRALATQLDADDDRELAVARLLDYYQGTAVRASALGDMEAGTMPVPADPIPTSVPELTSQEQAQAWTRAERANLLTCLDLVTAAGQPARVIALTAGLASVLRADGPWAEAVGRHDTAVRAARRVGDQSAEVGALRNRGLARRFTGDWPGAIGDLEEALHRYRGLSNQPGQAAVLLNLADTRRVSGDYQPAIENGTGALELYRELSDRRGQVRVHIVLGGIQHVIGNYQPAIRHLEEGLQLNLALGQQPDPNQRTYPPRVRPAAVGRLPGRRPCDRTGAAALPRGGQ